jgi:aryl-alcohol dehydrogenase-like predicted oxidoreductase
MKNKLVLGTVQFGLEYGINNTVGKPSRTEVFNILSLARIGGINNIDTADHYGNSQELIGEFNRHLNGDFIINTKFKVSGQGIQNQLDQSLQILGVKSIGVYFYHAFSEFVQHPDIKFELNKLKQALKLEKVGVSVYTNEEMEIAAQAPEIDVIQIPFNLLDNISRRGYWISKAKENGKLIQTRSVFLQGLFFKDTKNFPPALHPLRKYVDRLQSMARESGLTMENICMSYVLSQPDIDQVLIGVDSAEQLKNNLAYSRSLLDDRLRKEIDAIEVRETELLYPINWK